MDDTRDTIIARGIDNNHRQVAAAAQENTAIPRARQPPRGMAKRPRRQSEETDDDSLDTIVAASSSTDNAPSSPSMRRRPRSSRNQRCAACTGVFLSSELTAVPCSHAYCQSCLESLVRVSMKQEVTFPPRCCHKEVPIKVFKNFPKELTDQYEDKRVEFGTPASERLYCSSPACSAFIPPGQIDSGVGHCTGCQSDTCVACKQKEHIGACPEDKQSQAVLRLAEAAGWKRCERCGHIIEKSMGCTHMSKFEALPLDVI